MSTILKALRRLEEEKRPQQAATLEEDVLSPAESARRPRRGMLTLGVATGASLVVALGVAVYALSWLSTSGEPEIETLRVPASPQNPPSPPSPSRSARLRERHPAPPAVAAAPGRPAPAPAARIRRAPLEVVKASPPVETRDSAARVEDAVLGASAGSDIGQSAAVAPGSERPVAAAADVPSGPAREPARIDMPPIESDPPPVVSAAATSSWATPEAAVEVIERWPMPTLSVTRTIWHPDPARRVAVMKLLGRPPQRLGEGDRIAGFTVLEIGLADVELERDGVILQRRVGGNTR